MIFQNHSFPKDHCTRFFKLNNTFNIVKFKICNVTLHKTVIKMIKQTSALKFHENSSASLRCQSFYKTERPNCGKLI